MLIADTYQYGKERRFILKVFTVSCEGIRFWSKTNVDLIPSSLLALALEICLTLLKFYFSDFKNRDKVVFA